MLRFLGLRLRVALVSTLCLVEGICVHQCFDVRETPRIIWPWLSAPSAPACRLHVFVVDVTGAAKEVTMRTRLGTIMGMDRLVLEIKVGVLSWVMAKNTRLQRKAVKFVKPSAED